MLDRIETRIAQVGTNKRGFLLLHEAVVILVPGPAAREAHTLDGILPEGDEVVIEELAAIVRMDLVHREGQACQHAPEGVFHHQLAAPQSGGTLTPASRSLREDHVATSIICTVCT